MKDLLIDYGTYNIWANQKMFEKLTQLSGEQINQEIVSSFPSIYKTVLHMWNAEAVWWQRLKLAEKMQEPCDYFTGTFAEMVKASMQQSKQWEEWITNATDNQIQHVFAYQNTKKEQFKQPVYEMLLHLFNHGTYHRGQLVTMLRQLGVDKIPQTDFIIYSRNRK